MATPNSKRNPLQKLGIIPVGPKQLAAEGAAQYQSDLAISKNNQNMGGTSSANINQPTGSYDAAKGQYVSADGKIYPTQNPNFKPGQTGAGKTIEFKGDQVIVDGQAMSRQQYSQQAMFQDYNQQVAQAQQQQANEQIATQIGQEQQLPVSQGLGIDYGQAALQTGVGVAPAVATGAAGFLGTLGLASGAAGAGAAAGTAAGAAALGISTGGLALVAAGIAAAAVLIPKYVSNIKKQRTDSVGAQKKVLTDGTKSLNNLIKLSKATKDVEQRAQIIDAFNLQLSRIKQAQMQMQMDTKRDALKFEDATEELQAFENFYSAGGARDYYMQAMNMAIAGDIDINELNSILAEPPVIE